MRLGFSPIPELSPLAPLSRRPAPVAPLDLELVLYVLAAVAALVLLLGLYRARSRTKASSLEETEGEEHFRTPEDQMVSYANIMLDHLGRNMTWNLRIKRMFGYDKAEFIGASATHLYTPEDRLAGVPERDLAEAVEHGRGSAERWLVRKDETRFPASVSTSSVLSRQGQVTGFALKVRDLSEVKQVEEELRRSQEALELANEAAGLGTWDHDLVTGELRLDPRAKALFGLPPEAPVSYPAWVAAIHPDDILTAEAVLDRALRDRQPFTAHYRVSWPDGSIHWLAVIGRGSYSGGTDVPLRMRGILLDITERKRTEESMQEVLRLEAVGRLAGGIAHDLNNMLVAILGFSDLLAQSMGINDPRLEDVRQISQAAARSADLTRQLLAFARRELIRPRNLDLNGVVRYAGGILRPVLGENIALELNLSTTVGIIHADSGRIEQILMNLVLNSRDAMPQGGRVTVETASVTLEAPPPTELQPQSESPPAGRYAMLSVRDTGHGMDTDTLQRIWEPFFTTKPAGQGTGLGLSVVYGSVKQSGGFVAVESEIGSGTTVRVYWPEVHRETDSPGEAPAARPAERGKETVLVVEDEPVVRALVVRTLRGLGYLCLAAEDAEEALRVMEQEASHIHLVITDVVMPGLSGGDLGLRLAEQYPNLPVLYTSGFADDDIIRRGLLDPSRPFLPKPFTPTDLGRKVREVLDTAVREYPVENS